MPSVVYVSQPGPAALTLSPLFQERGFVLTLASFVIVFQRLLQLQRISPQLRGNQLVFCKRKEDKA